MTVKEEEFVHYCECCESLNQAWRLLSTLEASSLTGPIYDAAYRFALVEYCKSYTTSDGVHRYGRYAYKLAPPNLSPDKLSLHRQILKLRHQSLAHSELKLKEARIMFGRSASEPTFRITKKVAPPLPPIDKVIELVHESLGLLYSGMKKYLKPIT